MTGWKLAGLVVSSLLVLDALVCLALYDRVEGMLRRAFPQARIGPLLVLEGIGGLIGLALLLLGDRL